MLSSVAQSDLEFLSRLIHRQSGQFIEPDRMRQVAFKLIPVSRRFGFKSVETMVRELRHEPQGLVTAVVEAMTINETSFFRDEEPFVHFRNTVLPGLLRARAGRRQLRIWCAAASTGQEPYSLAMILEEERAALKDWAVQIIATDINATALAQARQGLYCEEELARGLTAERRLRHFSNEDGGWRIAAPVRRMVDFHHFNLMGDYAWLGELDVIICRNVLFYFDAPTKAAVLEKLTAALAPDGCLILGASESPRGSTRALEAYGPGTFRKMPGRIAQQRVG